MPTFLPGSDEDYRFIADVITAEFPDDPWDPAEARHWYTDSQRRWLRHLVEVNGIRSGYAIGCHDEWELAPERIADVYVGYLPATRTPDNLDAGYDFVEKRCRKAGARLAMAYVREDDAVQLSVIAARGYREERRQRFWELDLVAGQERLQALLERSRARMATEGVTIATMAALDDPDKYLKTHRMSSVSEMDVPTTGTHVPDSFERFMEWLDSPTVHQDRMWLARVGEAIVGLSILAYPVERGIVSTDWTCVDRSHRDRGIARALKLETVQQAIELGVDRVRTDNDFCNAPILHLNEDLGYRHVFDQLQLQKGL